VIFLQRETRLPALPRGCHKVTGQVIDALPELRQIQTGLLHIFLQHTSASLTINENADPDVLDDLDRVLDHVVPESFPYRHTCEGPDDMPAHGKTSLLGCSLTVPVGAGGLKLGTWQGICLCEHRNHGGRRRLVLTLFGQ
jgi:secondary thiamine-phosphate synthase enzyme